MKGKNMASKAFAVFIVFSLSLIIFSCNLNPISPGGDDALAGEAWATKGSKYTALNPSSGSTRMGGFLTSTVSGNPGGWCTWYWLRAEVYRNGIKLQEERQPSVMFDPVEGVPPSGGTISSTMTINALYEPDDYTIKVITYWKNSLTGAVWSSSAEYALTVQALNTWNNNADLSKDGSDDYSSDTWSMRPYVWVESTGPSYSRPNPNDNSEEYQSLKWVYSDELGKYVIRGEVTDRALNTIGVSAAIGQGSNVNFCDKYLDPISGGSGNIVVQADVANYEGTNTYAPSWTGLHVNIWCKAPNDKRLDIEMYFLGYGLADPSVFNLAWPTGNYEHCRTLSNGEIYDYILTIENPGWSTPSYREYFNVIPNDNGRRKIFINVKKLLENAMQLGKNSLSGWPGAGWDSSWQASDFQVIHMEFDYESGHKGFEGTVYGDLAKFWLGYY